MTTPPPAARGYLRRLDNERSYYSPAMKQAILEEALADEARQAPRPLTLPRCPSCGKWHPKGGCG